MDKTPLDRIYIRDLHARCILGIYPEEREKPQDIVVNIVLSADLRKAGISDCIEDTVDYKKVKLLVLELVESSSFYLVEKLAEEIARLCLTAAGVEEATVTVDKPGALRFAKSVAVEITRSRADW